MKSRTLALLIALGLACVAQTYAASVTVEQSTLTSGYMNVFELPSNGGAYVFGSPWGVADLTATFSGPNLTLGPNAVNDPSSFYYTPAGGPGAIGNKLMDANIYNETTGTYVGTTLTFHGTVLQNTLAGQAAQGNGFVWTTVAFIKDFVADYSSSVSVSAPLTPGAFAISLGVSADPGHHIQYGFEVIGSDIWQTDVGNYGTVVVVPEPSSMSLALLAGLGVFVWLRRRS